MGIRIEIKEVQTRPGIHAVREHRPVQCTAKVVCGLAANAITMMKAGGGQFRQLKAFNVALAAQETIQFDTYEVVIPGQQFEWAGWDHVQCLIQLAEARIHHLIERRCMQALNAFTSQSSHQASKHWWDSAPQKTPRRPVFDRHGAPLALGDLCRFSVNNGNTGIGWIKHISEDSMQSVMVMSVEMSVFFGLVVKPSDIEIIHE